MAEIEGQYTHGQVISVSPTLAEKYSAAPQFLCVNQSRVGLAPHLELKPASSWTLTAISLEQKQLRETLSQNPTKNALQLWELELITRSQRLARQVGNHGVIICWLIDKQGRQIIDDVTKLPQAAFLVNHNQPESAYSNYKHSVIIPALPAPSQAKQPNHSLGADVGAHSDDW